VPSFVFDHDQLYVRFVVLHANSQKIELDCWVWLDYTESWELNPKVAELLQVHCIIPGVL